MRWLFAVVGVLTCLTAQAGGLPQVIEVFSSTPPPAVRGVDVRYHDIGMVLRLEEQLSEGLSAEPGVAGETAAGRIARLPGELRESVAEGAANRERAAAYGVRRFPAVVVDGALIIEDTDDLGKVIRIWRKVVGR